jgi:hypothetical protein
MANPFGAATENEPIKGRMFNLTIFSGLGAAAVAAVAVFNDLFTEVFGDVGKGAGQFTAADLAQTKLVLLVAIIAALALIAIADMLARAWATSANKMVVIPVPGAPKVGTLDGDGVVAAMRVQAGAPDDVEYLLFQAGNGPTWVKAADVRSASGA